MLWSLLQVSGLKWQGILWLNEHRDLLGVNRSNSYTHKEHCSYWPALEKPQIDHPALPWHPHFHILQQQKWTCICSLTVCTGSRSGLGGFIRTGFQKASQSHPAATCTKITLRAYSLQLLLTKFINQSSSKPSLLWHCSVARHGCGFGVKKCSRTLSEIVFGYLGTLKRWHVQQEPSNKRHPRKTYHSSSPVQREVIFLPPSHLCAYIGLHRLGEIASKMLHVYFGCMSQNTDPKRTLSCKHLLFGINVSDNSFLVCLLKGHHMPRLLFLSCSL